jgi:hypothetical protein
MKSVKVLALAGVVALVAAAGVAFVRSGYGRQYYSGWQRSAQGFYFTTHHYRPDAGAMAFNTNYAVFYPETPRYIYFFNPLKGTYWGRFDVKTKGYSLLAEKDRAGRLKDIPEKAFPDEGPLPEIPDAKDKLTLAEPPDLPGGEKLDGAAATSDKTDAAVKPAATGTAVTALANAAADAVVAATGVTPAPASGTTPAPAAAATGGASEIEPSDGRFYSGCHRHSCH